MHALIIGAGPTGLVTAMLLAADGHRVTVFDQDQALDEGSAGSHSSRSRRGVGQFDAAHVLSPLGYRVLQRELPDVETLLLDRGGRQHNMIAGALHRIPRSEPSAADARFDTVAARRPVLEAALFAAAECRSGISVKHGIQVKGLITENTSKRGIPHVTGVVLAHGVQVFGDLVIAASGRGGLTRTLPDAVNADRSGRSWRYFTRHFRAANDHTPSHMPWPLHHHNSVSIIVVPGDSGTWSLTFVTSGDDQQLRRLRQGAAWHRAIALYPDLEPWSRGEPVGHGIAVGGIRSIRRRLVDNGQPLVTGLVALGDAWGTTNPQFGLGMSLGIIHATLLRDTLRNAAQSSPDELASGFDAVTEQNLEPVRSGLAEWDRHRFAEIDAHIRGQSYTTDASSWNQHVAFRSLGLHDADALRAMAELGFLLTDPNEVMRKQGLDTRLRNLALDVPRYAGGPDRNDLLAALDGEV
ncbi:FAD-dependent oxidoreductase [Streptomyces sp. NPDC088847]|uniref:FAD-dependent oxidoreductase n=1 Tax=Streptomyces sp. NPDC088847 TaxID=3365909 RepID=UPI0038119B89